MAGVRTTHPEYERFAPKWKRCRDAVGGRDSIHAARADYLPRLRDESDDDYRARLKRSDFFNGTWRTIAGLKGMAFRKNPTVEVPAGIEPYLEDITLSGTSMTEFAGEVLEETLTVRRLFILVDYPPTPENVTPMSVAAARDMGLRPTLQLYTAENVLNWRYASINNAWTLSMVVLKEVALLQKGEFESKPEDRYRVLDLVPNAQGVWTYRQRLFRINDKGEDEQIGDDVFPIMNGRPLAFIPGTFVGSSSRGALDDPPMIDLVDANIALYQINADYRHALHFTALPTPYICGWSPPLDDKGQPGKLYIGSTSAWVFTDPETKVGFLEFVGQGLDGLKRAIEDKKLEMALLGARMIADEARQAETLGATQIKRAGENSVLAQIVLAVSKSLEWCLSVFAEWAGHPGEVTYQINRDFLPTILDAQQLQALFAGVQAGVISMQDAFDLLKRGDVIAPEKTYEDHQAQIAEAGPPRPRLPAANEGGLAA